MSSYTSSHLSETPSVRFEEECVLIPEVGPIKPRLATRKYSVPLSFRRSAPSEYMYDPSFIPGPPTPTFSIRLPALSRAPPRPRLKSTSSTSSVGSDAGGPSSPSSAGPSRPGLSHALGSGRGLERRRSTGQGFMSSAGQVKLTKAAGIGQEGEDAAAVAYWRQYGVKSCLVHEARVEVPGRERGRDRKARGEAQGASNGNGHAAGMSSPISFVHPGRITEEPESEEPTPRAGSPASPPAISSSLPNAMRSPFRRGTSGMRSRSRSSAGNVDSPLPAGSDRTHDPSLPRIPLRACCSACRLATDLGSRDASEWEIGFDRKAQEKRARDEAEQAHKDGIAETLAKGGSSAGNTGDDEEDVVVAPMKGVVVDEVDSYRRRGSDPAVLNGHVPPPHLDDASEGSASPSQAEEPIWITTRPRPSPTSSPRGPDTHRVGSSSPLATEPVSAAGGYFDVPQTIAEKPETGDDAPSRRGSAQVANASQNGPSMSAAAGQGSKTGRVENKLGDLKIDDKVVQPPLQRTASNQTAPAKPKKGGWLGMSITKALGVM